MTIYLLVLMLQGQLALTTEPVGYSSASECIKTADKLNANLGHHSAVCVAVKVL
jgi:hypothetical protein